MLKQFFEEVTTRQNVFSSGLKHLTSVALSIITFVQQTQLHSHPQYIQAHTV